MNVKFDKKWLKENKDSETILQNFIYVFGIFDPISGFLLVSNKNNFDSLLDYIASYTKYDYKISELDKMSMLFYKLLFNTYYDFLKSEKTDLEEIFAYYYNEHLKIELKNSNFTFNPTSKESKYYDRGKAIIPELDSILKQYDLFQEYKEVDEELFELNSKGKTYSSLKSINDKKFIYLNEKNDRICQLLFSKNSILAKSMLEFYQRVKTGVNESDFKNTQRDALEILITNDVIGIGVGKQVFFKSELYISILHILWKRGYLCLTFIDQKILDLVENEVNNGNLYYGSTLFSVQESNYISYIMDDKLYSNGSAIRNKFTHGSYAKKMMIPIKKTIYNCC